MHVLTPTTLDAALAMLATAPAPLTPIAGGTDLLVSWPHQPKRDLVLLDLSRLDGSLRTIRLTDASLVLGGLVTYWDVIRHAEVCRTFPLLPEAARQIGAIQIQTRGTWAGNIGNGSPAADGVPVLMAYDATVTLASAAGRRVVRLDQYYTGYRQSVRRPDELIVAIELPRRPVHFAWFHKVGARAAQAITKAGVAMVHDTAGWRVAANSVGPKVCRCGHLEAALARGTIFRSPDEVEVLLAANIQPIDDMRSTARYRRRVLARLIYHRLTGAALG
jgi:CO/xanthine dehydrogenase FAD-binding subunit